MFSFYLQILGGGVYFKFDSVPTPTSPFAKLIGESNLVPGGCSLE